MTTLSALPQCFFLLLCAIFFKMIFEAPANPAHLHDEGVRMDYLVDLDSTHGVIRLTVTAEIVTLEMAEDCYICLARIASRGGPYAAIYDLSAVTETTRPLGILRSLHLRVSCYLHLARIASRGGPYAAICDLSAVTGTTRPTEMVRSYARRDSSIRLERTHVVVGKAPAIFGLARIFQMCSDALGHQFEVVWTLQEAYDMVGVRPEDFAQRLFPEEMAA